MSVLYLRAPRQDDQTVAARLAALNATLVTTPDATINRYLADNGLHVPAVVVVEKGRIVGASVDANLDPAAVANIAGAVSPADAGSIVARANLAAIATKAKQALTANATYLATGTPTTAQAVAQVAALTRQVDALIRFVFAVADTTGGT